MVKKQSKKTSKSKNNSKSSTSKKASLKKVRLKKVVKKSKSKSVLLKATGNKKSSAELESAVFAVSNQLLKRKNEQAHSVDLMFVESFDEWFTVDGLSAEFFSRIDGVKSVSEIEADLGKSFLLPSSWKSHRSSLIKELLESRLILKVAPK